MIGCLPTQALAFLAVFVYATHATQAIAFEWKPGLTVLRPPHVDMGCPSDTLVLALRPKFLTVALLVSVHGLGFMQHGLGLVLSLGGCPRPRPKDQNHVLGKLVDHISHNDMLFKCLTSWCL